MKYIKRLVVLNLFLCNLSCHNKENSDHVFFDSSFLSGRVDSIVNVEANKYTAYVSPSFEPVNDSPWFAFQVWTSSDDKKEIEVNLNYGKYSHRYVPKISTDKKNWRSIDLKKLKVDTISGIATLTLNISNQKMYVSAQEIESSKDTYRWMDSILKKHPKLKKVISGKTVLKKDNYALVFENDTIKNCLVLIARQHPPEIPGGSFGFKSFYKELMSNTDIAVKFRENFNIYAFPLLNPDGVDMGNWRHNANGVDLNRDWIDFEQPETKMVKTFLSKKVKEGKIINFAVDFHTSYSGPYLLVLDSINEKKVKGIIPKWKQNIESASNFSVEARKRSQELPYCYNWFYKTFNCEAVTYEEGDEIDRKIIAARAKLYAHELMKIFLLMVSD